MTLERLRVELNDFCKQFSASLQPFSTSLDETLRALRGVKESANLQSGLNALLDNRHRLKILHDKARQQNAYLVIFGPLKSGKSTLMNAISGAYVSEVTSLPAYPCLVYVHEGDERRFSTTNFNGEEKSYDSPNLLSDTIQHAHEELAERIRGADERGESFNPAENFQEAIRRIDFTVPAPFLRESGTILVDTPGLYAKMKYNYGQLTRDFRDTAACAVFVVKTDNLFFERVFEEFADLLEIFSRVFLVVNIDSTKQDLGPDGQLQPSLERQNPQKIIETFENLTLSAQIQSAIQSGRLRIYAIDLLQTACQSLQQQNSGSPGDGPSEESDGTESGEENNAPTEGHAKIGFPAFLKDLTEYLNSSDYIAEFMADSLRQTTSILHEIDEEITSESLREFREGIDALRDEAQQARRQLQEVRRLQEDSWDGPLNELTREISQQVTEHSGSVVPSLKQAAHREVEAWIESDESMEELVNTRIRPTLEKTCGESRQRARQLIDGICESRNGGLRLSDDLVARINDVGLHFNDIYARYQPQVEERFSSTPPLPEADNIQAQLPMQKTFVDYLLFRSPARIRKAIFGTEFPSGKPIPAQVKSKRFNPDSIEALFEWVDNTIEEAFKHLIDRDTGEVLDQFREFFLQQTSERLEHKAIELEEQGKSAQQRYERRREVAGAMDQLDKASAALRGDVEQLHEAFVKGKLSVEIEAFDTDHEDGAVEDFAPEQSEDDPESGPGETDRV